MKYLFSLAVFVLTLGTVGHMDYQDAQLKQASITCQAQTSDSTPTFEQCINNQLENNSDH